VGGQEGKGWGVTVELRWHNRKHGR